MPVSAYHRRDPMRARAPIVLLLCLVSAFAVPMSARANVALGQPLPAFTKSLLGGGTVSPSQYSGKVLVLQLFGYGCPFCISDGPSVQGDLQQAYANSHPGQVQVVGIDMWNGTASQVNVFRQQTGATYPLGLNGATATGGNVETLVGPFDNYVVVSKQGIVRYHAALIWPHGNRYHLDEIRAAIDSLVTPVLDAPGAPPALAFAAGPSPARGPVSVTLALAQSVSEARVDVIDITGRQVATLASGALAAGRHEFRWDPTARAVPAGVYMVRAALGARSFVRRVVVTR